MRIMLTKQILPFMLENGFLQLMTFPSAEIDGKVQDILKYLKEEDGNNDRKEPIADLIEDFHNHYQSLYARYDHLIKELREKAYNKHEKNSSSSSSDSSDSDDSPTKKGKQNGKAENKFEKKNTAIIKQELEMALSEVGDLKRKLATTEDEKEVLYLEYQSALSKSQEAKRIMVDLVTEGEKWSQEKSKLSTENTGLNEELESSRKLQAELNQRLEDMIKERERLIASEAAAFFSIEEEKRNFEELRTINRELQHEKEESMEEKESLIMQMKDLNLWLSQLQEENTKLQLRSSEMEKASIEKENELKIVQGKYEDQEAEASVRVTALTEDVNSLTLQIEKLKEELLSQTVDGERVLEENESLAAELMDLKLELESLHHQKNELQDQLNSKLTEGNQLTEEKSGLWNRISELEKTLIEREDDVISIQKKLEDVQNDASTKIDALREQISSFQKDLELLQSEKRQLEVQIARGNQESVETLAQAENQNAELVNKIIELDTKLKEQYGAFIKLKEDHEQLGVQFRNCEECLKSSEKKIDEMTDQFHKDMDAKNQEIDQLEEKIEDLKTELEMKVEDINRLVDNMRTTEVKQRLTSQKLHITEQLLSENEEILRRKVEKLQEEQKLLEKRIAILSGIIVTYKEAQVKLRAEISDKVNETLIGIDTFSVKFEEDYGHLQSRIYEIMNELKVTRNWIAGNNAEKNKLKDDISSLVQQLKEEKEQELQLAVRIKELEIILRKDEDERKILTETIKQREEKMGELEKMIGEREMKMGELERKVNEKDNGILSLGEEKREAIRQLCIWIDYHHNRYDDLRGMILKTRGGRRHIAT